MQADRLLGPAVSDVDGNTEERKGTISVFNGPPPQIQIAANQSAETGTIKTWLTACIKDGIAPHEIGMFVRSAAELPRALDAAKAAALPAKILDEHVSSVPGHLSVGTMHLAKGLEFRAVVVMACDDSVIPLQQRIESVIDESDLEEVYNTERHLLTSPAPAPATSS
jgi:superfamily I DNA/RNA helicase